MTHVSEVTSLRQSLTNQIRARRSWSREQRGEERERRGWGGGGGGGGGSSGHSRVGVAKTKTDSITARSTWEKKRAVRPAGLTLRRADFQIKHMHQVKTYIYMTSSETNRCIKATKTATDVSTQL